MLTGVNHITISVNELEESLAFYVELLGMSLVVKWNQGAYLTLGDMWFCLSCGTSQPRDDYGHIAFSIEQENFHEFVSMLDQRGVRKWKENSSEGSSSYILAPNGHKLEVHCGNLNTRLQELRNSPYEGLVWCK